MDFGRITDPNAWKQAMAGLLRRGGEVTDYIATAPEKAGQAIIEGHQKNKALQAQAFANPNRPFQVTDANAMSQLGERMLAGPLSVAPVGMMIGPSAATWSKENAFKAAQMEKAGKNPQEIWEATQTAKGLDNFQRQEIPDNRSFLMGGNTFGETVMNRMKALETDVPKVGDILYHNELFEAYPQLKNIEIQFTKKGNTAKAEWLPTENIIRVNSELPTEQAKNSLLHELQHAVQKEEAWNTGADAHSILKKHFDKRQDIENQIDKLNQEMKQYSGKPELEDKYLEVMSRRNKLVKQYSNDPYADALKEYKAYGGEAEARLTQGREKLTKEERAKIYPYTKGDKALDIDPESALIRMNHDQPVITRKELIESLLSKQK